jgi:curved DNA-binding protein CbpA
VRNVPTHDLYAILGIPPDANLATIKRAYRDSVFTARPDTGRPPNPARFNDVLHAYQVLSDGDRRRSYNQAIRRAARDSQLARRPIIRETVDVPEGFASAAPSIGEFLDHVAQNFFGFHRKSHGLRHSLGVDYP